MRIPAVSLVVIVALWGCGNSGAFLSGNTTTVELSEPNYNLVATNISGQASVEYLFGVSYSMGLATYSMGIFRLEGSADIYNIALQELWNNFREEHGSPTGEPLALVNVRYDADLVNFLLYTKATVSVRADVVQFTQ